MVKNAAADSEDREESDAGEKDGAKAKRKGRRRGKAKPPARGSAASDASQEFSGVTWIALIRHIVFAGAAIVAAVAGYLYWPEVVAWLGWSVVPLGIWSTFAAYLLVARTGMFFSRFVPIAASGLVTMAGVGALGVFDAPLGSSTGPTLGGRLAEYVVREPFTWDRYNPNWWLPVQAWARVGALMAIGVPGITPIGYLASARLAAVGLMLGFSMVLSTVVAVAGFIVAMASRIKLPQRSTAEAPEEAMESAEASAAAAELAARAQAEAASAKAADSLPDGHPLKGVENPEGSPAVAAFKRHGDGEPDYSGVRKDSDKSGLGDGYQIPKERVVFGMGQTLYSKPAEEPAPTEDEDPAFVSVAEALGREADDALTEAEDVWSAEMEGDGAGAAARASANDVIGDDGAGDGGATEDHLTGDDDDDVAERGSVDASEEVLVTPDSGIDADGSDGADNGSMAFDAASEFSTDDFADIETMLNDAAAAADDTEPAADDAALEASRLEEALRDFPWHLPPGDALEPAPTGGVTAAEIEATSELIEESLAQHGVEVSVDQIRVGPTVTMYGLKPGWKGGGPNSKAAAQRVRVDTILNREKDIALALKCPNIRFESVVPGAAVVGVEVPNENPTPVNLRSVMDTEQWQTFAESAALPVPLGMGSGGEPVMADFATMPHTLVAGATGSGKSVCINTIVTGLLLCRNPMELRMVMIDPKRVELTPYQGIPHLLTPVVVEAGRALAVLKACRRTMMQRFEMLEAVGAKNIGAYNARSDVKMPYLLIVVDELADLMLAAGNEVEQELVRLAQLGRATGVHLVVATQRPSVDVVTGLIKANFPSRISFSVMSQVDSRTILDSNGADKLLGKGDMLYKPINLSSPMRVQGAYLAEDEIETVVGFWRDGGTPPLPQLEVEFDAEASTPGAPSADADDDGEAGLLRSAVEMSRGQKTLSTSFLQRKLKIGYPRAARLMDDLEDAGVVGPGEPGKPRKVLQQATT